MNVPAATRLTFIPDIQGLVIATLDSGSGTLTKTGYLAYGENVVNTSGTFRFTGRRLDGETGGSAAQPSGLYYYRARTYSPTWGRFLQTDPIGYAGGVNLYAYVCNDPLNLTDATGLYCVPCVTAVTGGLLGVAGAYFSDPEHFGLRSAAVGFGVGFTAGLFNPVLASAVRGATVTSITTRAGITVGTNLVAGAGGSIGTDLATGQPPQYGKALLIGAFTGLSPLVSGEAAIAGFGTGLTGASEAAIEAWMQVPSATVSIPAAYPVNRPQSQQSVSPTSGLYIAPSTLNLPGSK